jgi:hypothetical protein
MAHRRTMRRFDGGAPVELRRLARISITSNSEAPRRLNFKLAGNEPKQIGGASGSHSARDLKIVHNDHCRPTSSALESGRRLPRTEVWSVSQHGATTNGFEVGIPEARDRQLAVPEPSTGLFGGALFLQR